MNNHSWSIFRKILPLILIFTMILSVTTISSCSVMQRIADRISPDSSAKVGSVGTIDDEMLTALDFDMFADSVTSDTLSLHFAVADPEALGLMVPKVGFWEASKAESDAWYAQSQDYLDQLESIDYVNLSAENQIIFDVIEYDLNEALQYEPYYYYSSPFNSLTGLQTNLPLMMSDYTFDSRQDVDDYIDLLIDTYRLYEDMLVFESERAAEGLGASDENLQKLIDSCASFMEDPEDHFLVSSFADRLDTVEGLTDAEKKDYIERNQAALDEYVFPAYQLLIDGFTDLMGTGVNDGGLCNFENGKDYYALLLDTETSTDVSVDEATEQLDGAIDDGIALLTAVTFDDEFYDAYLSYNFSEGSVQENLDYCSDAIKTDFPSIMEHNVVLKNVPSQLEEFFSPAAYLSCRIDDPTDNVILTNMASLEGYQNLLETIAHEGYPGHMYEAIYHAENISSYYQRYASFIAYSEGWAEYASAYILAQSDFDQELVEYVSVESAIYNLYFPARIDIGVNYEGWDRQDVYDYLLEYNMDYPEYADGCYDRAIEIPCYIMKYAFGQINTFEILDNAQNELEDTVSLKDIHEAYLAIGPAPFSIIEKYMDVYIEKAQE